MHLLLFKSSANMEQQFYIFTCNLKNKNYNTVIEHHYLYIFSLISFSLRNTHLNIATVYAFVVYLLYLAWKKWQNKSRVRPFKVTNFPYLLITWKINEKLPIIIGHHYIIQFWWNIIQYSQCLSQYCHSFEMHRLFSIFSVQEIKE